MDRGAGQQDGHINYLAGTSLDEVDDRVWPPRRRHVVRLSTAVRAYRQRQIDIAQAVAVADHHGDILEQYRRTEDRLTLALGDQLQHWRRINSNSHDYFAAFMETAVLATNTMVAATSIFLWHPSIPAAVRHALQDLNRFYHGEAPLLRNVYIAQQEVEVVCEREAESMLSATEREERNEYRNRISQGQHQEIWDAASRTTLRTINGNPRSIPTVQTYTPFGHESELASVAKFESYDRWWYDATRTSVILKWVDRLHKIRANLRVRKSLTQLNSPIRWTKKGERVFSKTVDRFVLDWMDAALEYLSTKAAPRINSLSTNGSGNRNEVIATFEEVYNEILMCRRKLGKLAGMRQRVLDEYYPTAERYKKAIKELPRNESESDDDDEINPQIAELNEELEAMEGDFDEFETKHGRVIGWEWRDICNSRDSWFNN